MTKEGTGDGAPEGAPLQHIEPDLFSDWLKPARDDKNEGLVTAHLKVRPFNISNPTSSVTG
jgi:hypothetical protein